LFFLFFYLEHIVEETSLSVLSTADLLREKLAFITGGTNHIYPILTFPDNPQIEFTQEKYKKLVSYLTQVPRYIRYHLNIQITFVLFFSENERQLGFVLIIDRRTDRWTAVKSIISYIEVNITLIDIQCKTKIVLISRRIGMHYFNKMLRINDRSVSGDININDFRFKKHKHCSVDLTFLFMYIRQSSKM